MTDNEVRTLDLTASGSGSGSPEEIMVSTLERLINQRFDQLAHGTASALHTMLYVLSTKLDANHSEVLECFEQAKERDERLMAQMSDMSELLSTVREKISELKHARQKEMESFQAGRESSAGRARNIDRKLSELCALEKQLELNACNESWDVPPTGSDTDAAIKERMQDCETTLELLHAVRLPPSPTSPSLGPTAHSDPGPALAVGQEGHGDPRRGDG